MALLSPLARTSGHPPVQTSESAPYHKHACFFVIATVAAAWHLDIDDLIGIDRGTARIARARQIAMYIAHVRMRIPQTRVAVAFNRDRTTVGYACRVIEEQRDDQTINRLLSTFEFAVQAWTQAIRNAERTGYAGRT